MRIRLRVSFSTVGIDEDRARRLLSSIGVEANPTHFYSARAWETNTRAQALIEAIEAEGIEPLVGRERVFSDRECREAQLLRLIVRRAPKGYGGSTIYGNAYDLSQGCPRCGTGAPRTTSLLLRRSDLPRTGDIIETGQGEFLVSPRLVDVFEAARINVPTRRARSSRDGEDLPWFELAGAITMPRMDAATRGGVRDAPCVACDRAGYYDSPEEPLDIAYDRAALGARLPDAANTWECFGQSWLEPPSDRHINGARFAQPLLLVSPKVYDALQRARANRVTFEPVRLV